MKKKSERRKSMNDEKIVKHIHWGANNSYQNNYVIVLWRCNVCLGVPMNEHSEKPVCYKPDEKKLKKAEKEKVK